MRPCKIRKHDGAFGKSNSFPFQGLSWDVDWSSLPPELLDKIVKRLTINADYLRFPAVCNNWRCATPSPPTHLPCQIPWLMLPSCNENTPFDDTRYLGDFFNLSDNNKRYHIDLPESYTRPRCFKFSTGKRCFGSSLGWLSFVDFRTLSITLFNPLTKAQILLPPISTLPGVDLHLSDDAMGHVETCDCYGESYNAEEMADLCFKKFFFSKNHTSSNNYISIIVFSEDSRMVFCRAGDDKWWPLIQEEDNHDGIFHKEQFYGVSHCGILTTTNLDPCDPKVKTVASWVDSTYPGFHYKKYLVEDLSGELMMVIRCKTFDRMDVRKTKSFSIYKFIPTSEEWIWVTSLDDYTLFLGMNSSFSLSAKDVLPKGCKPNCIYFTDDADISFEFGGHDSGIFNLEDASIQPLSCYGVERLWIWPPPLWITPSLT